MNAVCKSDHQRLTELYTLEANDTTDLSAQQIPVKQIWSRSSERWDFSMPNDTPSQQHRFATEFLWDMKRHIPPFEGSVYCCLAASLPFQISLELCKSYVYRHALACECRFIHQWLFKHGWRADVECNWFVRALRNTPCAYWLLVLFLGSTQIRMLSPTSRYKLIIRVITWCTLEGAKPKPTRWVIFEQKSKTREVDSDLSLNWYSPDRNT